jgi:SAM-dependent methyltransferase
VDAVAIWNTFDQMPEPEPVLAAARRCLRPGGVLALRVPNGDCFRLLSGASRRLPRPLAGWLRAAMAWNNLLAFPYLYGYSLRTLDRLLSRHGMARVAASPDILPRLADDHTKTWAAWEERALKLLFRLAAFPPRRLSLAPWLDVYYRLP